MVMLSLFVRSGYRVGVAHCNFQLRGVESEEDEELVRREAEKYGVPWYNKRFDTKGEMERTGESMEMAATPGSSLPSMYSSSAPPPVET